MAAHLRTATAFKISTSLFLKEDGSPYRFYYENESDDLRCILRKGLGCLVDDPTEADVLLCEKKTDNKITQGYLPIDFIVDCVKRNTFLDMEAYRAHELGLKASASKDQSLNSPVNGGDDSGDERNLMFSKPSRIQVKSDGLLGRKKYSDMDDMKIIEYLIHHKKYMETGGNLVWKQMELVKVTSHSHQSMKDRFRKKIRPEIDTFKIPDGWKAKIRGSFTDDNDDDDDNDEDSGEKIDFNKIDNWNNELRKSSKKKVHRVSPSTCSSSKNAVSETSPPTSPLNNHSSEGQPCPCAGENLNDSELEISTVCSSETREVGKDDTASNHSGNLEESLLQQDDVEADKEQRQNGENYDYDDMDYLILSEAGKCKNSDVADTVSNHSNDSSTRVTTKGQSKAIDDISFDENVPANSKKVSPPSDDNVKKRHARKNKVILNFHNTTSSSESEEEDKYRKRSDRQKVSYDKAADVPDRQKITSDKAGGDSYRQKVTSGKAGSDSYRQKVTSDKAEGDSYQQKVTFNKAMGDSYGHKVSSDKAMGDSYRQKVTSERAVGVSDRHKVTSDRQKETSVSEKHVNSVHTILNVINEGCTRSHSPKAFHRKVASRKESASISDSDSVDSVEETSSHSKSQMPRNSSPKATASGANDVRTRPEHERTDTDIVNNNFERSKKKLKKLAFRKAYLNKSHSGFDDSDEETSEQHPKSSRAISSKPSKRTLQSDESDVSSCCSPHKRKRKQPCTVARSSAESVRLDSRRKSPPRDKSSKWLTMKEIMLRVKFISEAYHLDKEEAAILLKLHKGSFLSAITYLESL